MIRRKYFSTMLTMPNAAMTLIEMMVALGISSIVILIGLKIVDLLQLSSKQIDQLTEVTQLKSELLTVTNCMDTTFNAKSIVPACDFSPNSCPVGRYLNVYRRTLRDSAGKVIVTPPLIGTNNTSTFEGNINAGYRTINARASCTCCPECTYGKKVFIEYQEKKAANTGLPGPWKDLFGGVPFYCVVP